jgi:hypothetical protein
MNLGKFEEGLAGWGNPRPGFPLDALPAIC